MTTAALNYIAAGPLRLVINSWPRHKKEKNEDGVSQKKISFLLDFLLESRLVNLVNLAKSI